MRADKEWEVNAGDGAAADEALDFARDILPDVRGASLVTLMQTTGLSRRYCWRIKTGQQVPHPRHWATLLSALRGAPASDQGQLPALRGIEVSGESPNHAADVPQLARSLPQTAQP